MPKIKGSRERIGIGNVLGNMGIVGIGKSVTVNSASETAVGEIAS